MTGSGCVWPGLVSASRQTEKKPDVLRAAMIAPSYDFSAIVNAGCDFELPAGVCGNQCVQVAQPVTFVPDKRTLHIRVGTIRSHHDPILVHGTGRAVRNVDRMQLTAGIEQ